jgi:hypothetical protein
MGVGLSYLKRTIPKNQKDMSTWKFVLVGGIFALTTLMSSSCDNEEDQGPLQADARDYAFVDFERLEMGDAFVVTVEESETFSVHVRGDRRNLDRLIVTKTGSTLKIGFDRRINMNYTTFIDIGMPKLSGVNFSGASTSTIAGFSDAKQLDIILSGASTSQMNIDSESTNVILSGASQLTVSGKGSSMITNVSGASQFSAFNFPVQTASIDVSGASGAKVNVAATLKAMATGASFIFYRGNATVNSSVSGASIVKAD